MLGWLAICSDNSGNLRRAGRWRAWHNRLRFFRAGLRCWRHRRFGRQGESQSLSCHVSLLSFRRQRHRTKQINAVRQVSSAGCLNSTLRSSSVNYGTNESNHSGVRYDHDGRTGDGSRPIDRHDMHFMRVSYSSCVASRGQTTAHRISGLRRTVVVSLRLTPPSAADLYCTCTLLSSVCIMSWLQLIKNNLKGKPLGARKGNHM